MRWILSFIFSAVIIFMSLSLMCKLRIRFDDFYAEYGCILWIVFIIQALSMLILSICKGLIIYNDAIRESTNDISEKLFWTFTVIYNIVTFIVPLLTQLSCLIFGWIRHRRGLRQPQKP